MARGDVTVFEEAKAYMIDGGWASAHDIKCAVVTNDTVPTASDAAPALGSYTEVTATGAYTAGGTSLGTLAACVTEAAGTMKFDSATNPSWSQNSSGHSSAHYAVIYNDTAAGDPAIAFVDLAGPVDMTAGDLTITWNASGIFTIT